MGLLENKVAIVTGGAQGMGAFHARKLVEAGARVAITDIPMKRIGNPEEVSNMVVFLASDMSSYSTGGAFVSDGGIIAT